MINDALRYMRVPPDARERDADLYNRVISGFERLKNIMRPRKTWGKFPVLVSPLKEVAVRPKGLVSPSGGDVANGDREGLKNLDIAGIKINSVNLKNLLKNSEECCLMAVTLGHEVDREIFLSQQRDISEGLIFDACASVMADVICDELENEIKDNLKIKLTPRFSPGYGDVPLSVSEEIIEVLNANKYIGLSVTRSGMLSPVKSITAFAGILVNADKNNCGANNFNFSKCDVCSGNKNCPYSENFII